MQVSEGVIHRGQRPRWITPSLQSLIFRILRILRKQNSIIAKYLWPLNYLWVTFELSLSYVLRGFIYNKDKRVPDLWESLLIYCLADERQRSCSSGINPSTPMQAVTGPDEPWPFFHFWCHHFWPKLASSVLNFCGRNAQKCSKSAAKNSDQNLLPLHLAASWWKLPVSMTLS